MRNSFCVFLFIYLLDLHKHYNELVEIVRHLMALLDMKALLVATIFSSSWVWKWMLSALSAWLQGMPFPGLRVINAILSYAVISSTPAMSVWHFDWVNESIQLHISMMSEEWGSASGCWSSKDWRWEWEDVRSIIEEKRKSEYIWK